MPLPLGSENFWRTPKGQEVLANKVTLGAVVPTEPGIWVRHHHGRRTNTPCVASLNGDGAWLISMGRDRAVSYTLNPATASKGTVTFSGPFKNWYQAIAYRDYVTPDREIGGAEK